MLLRARDEIRRDDAAAAAGVYTVWRSMQLLKTDRQAVINTTTPSTVPIFIDTSANNFTSEQDCAGPRCTHGFAAAARAAPGTDGQTDGLGAVLTRLPRKKP